ncbi:general stress protein [Corynebacterium lubricantis]|uniref:general stress protein n=1 Tax=Corynebacterium lubricantis TaxID=541095 RepID=UPI00038219D5|nr:general stress protein [Corynebacterium lubricantis]
MTPNSDRAQRIRPDGWPVGSFNTYLEAQNAVDALSDREFPVEETAIVGVDLYQVEKVTGRLTWGRVLGGGAFAGAWWGLFIGLLFGLFTPALWAVILSSIVIGAIFGLIFAAIAYGATGGARDFTSTTNIVAGRYDVICTPARAEEARDIIASLGTARPQDQMPRGNQGQSHPENDPRPSNDA